MRAPLRRWIWHPIGLVVVFATAFGGCQGNGCSCMTPIPGGFPAKDRTPNAAQLRVSSTGIAAIEQNPAAIISALVPGGLTFNVPANCGGSPSVCCPGGTAQSPCGPIDIDISMHAGDSPRLVIAPQQGKSTLDVTLNARVKTAMDVPVNIPVFGDCGLAIDTAPGPTPDIQLVIPVALTQDATAGTTRVTAGTVTINNLTTDDVKLNGGFGCSIANAGLGLFLSTLDSTFASAIQSAVNGQVCKQCASGDKADCGSFASACTNMVCEEGSQCLEELGITGRMSGTSLFSALSPGTTGSIDLYEVAGGYATTDSNGVALGLLGGMLPSGAPRDACGPPSSPPAMVTIPQSKYFQGNTDPDDNQPFDVAIGVHKSQLDQFAYASYNGGLLCLTVGTDTVGLINSDTFGLFLRSLSNLTSNATVPMAIGLRPQSPPVITLGKNTFTGSPAMLQEPLLDVKFTALEIDIFAQIEGQYVRLFTVVSDLDLPVGLQVGSGGALTPVLGDLTNAFTNVSVKNSDPMTESPAELANIFPMILQLALPKLAGGLGAINVPTIGGLTVDVTSITAVDNDTFLAIFGNLALPMSIAPTGDALVDTTVQVTHVTAPRTDVFADASRWTPDRRPAVAIQLGGSAPDLEYQVRIDDGLWSPWSPEAERVLSSDLFWLQGKHTIEARARLRGVPSTADATPAKAIALIDTQPPEARVERVGDEYRIDGHDAVSKDAVTVRWRTDAGAWHEAKGSAEVSLGDAAPESLEVQVVDEAGNVSPTRGSSAAPVEKFHGAPGTGGGCACGASGGGAGAGAAALFVAVMLVGGRQRRRAWRVMRRALPSIAIVMIGGSLEGCSCSHNPCGDTACQPGEVMRGAIGRWNSIATDGTRTVATTYDQTLGDLVLVDLSQATPAYSVIDGVPDEPATYDPSTYRGGIPDAGPDVGAWSSVALVSGKVRAAYQDRDRKALRYAAEAPQGGFAAHDVDVPMDAEEIGPYAKLAIDASGKPAIAYIATGVSGTGGTMTTELRLARASSAAPQSTGDWTITTIATGVRACAGLCGTDHCVKSATAGMPETCQAATTDCTPACGSGDVCVAAACLTEDTNQVVSLPGGVGMFANLLVLSDGRLVIVHYDLVRTALVAEIETGAGTSMFAETVLDGMDANDRGQWATAVADSGDTIHVAYQDALTDELFYLEYKPGGSPGTPEVVDDGTRTGDRTHNVGAGARLWLDGGSTPRVAYQDGMSSDMYLATRGTSGWTTTDAVTGIRLDGFHIAAPPGGGWLVWDGIDQTTAPATTLQVKQNP